MIYCVKLYKALAVIATLIVSLSNVYSYNIYQSEGWSVLKSTQNELILTYKPVIQAYDTIITVDNVKTITPIIKGAFTDGKPGEAKVLFSQVNITVPGPDDFLLENYEIISQTYSPYYITPNPDYNYQLDSYDLLYKFDLTKYFQANEFKPVELKYLGISRVRHLASLKIAAARYENGNIIIPNEVFVKIKFKPVYNQSINSQDRNYDMPLSINHEQTQNWLINQPNISKDRKLGDAIQSSLEQTWVKIKIDKDGVYKISAGQLSSLGLKIIKEDIPTIKVYSNGGEELSEKVSDAINNKLNEQEIIVRTTQSGDLDKIIFYGNSATGFKYFGKDGFKHYMNHYGESNYYLLTWKGSKGKRSEPLASIAGDPVYKPTTYTNMAFFEEEMINAYTGGSGRQWFGRNLLPATFTEQLHNLDRTGEIFYRISVVNRGEKSGYFKIKENNQEIMNIPVNAVSGYFDAWRTIQTGTFPASKISTDNRSSLQFDFTVPGGSSASGHFDYYEIYYPSFLTPFENQIKFFTDPKNTGITEYSINNFTNSDILGFDVTDPANPKQIKNDATTGGMFIFKTNSESVSPMRYFISANLMNPASIDKIDWVDLRNSNDNTESILITHSSLLESAKAYKKYREAQSNIKVKIVTTENIYNEFGSGIADITAIRDYLAYTFNNWDIKPKYVLLWGDGHYDYKQLSTSAVNFVPTYQTEDDTDSFYGIDSYTTDDYFANIAGNDFLMDMAIGRLPVYSNDIGMWLVQKINLYENESSLDSWRTKMTVVADDSWRSGGQDYTLHTGQAESLWTNVIPDIFQVKKIYLPEYPIANVSGGRRKPRANEELLTTVNTTGNLLLTYIGHGNPRVWAHEEVFERSITIPQMKNLDKLFFVTAASCDFGRFDSPEIRSGAEELVLSKVGGAIASFTSTRLVFAENNRILNEALFSKIFSMNTPNGTHYTIGEASMQAKIYLHGDNDLKYCLLADPSLKLLLPDHGTVIESINGVNVTKNDTAIVKALSNIIIEGHITYPSSTITDETFNGTVILTMLDSDQYMEVLEEDGSENGTTHRYYKNGGALNRSSFKVINGKFEAQFYIPKDISYADTTGRLYAYAYSDDNKFASGDNRRFIISGIDTSYHGDQQGPDIQVYLDSRDFVTGDYVNCVPLLIVDLKDSNGINTTGLGLGHRIEAWIDGSPTSIDLTEKFQTSVDDSKSGTAEVLLFNLKPGYHSIKIRAWDVFNNYATAESYFRTTDCDNIIIGNLLSYPNPTDYTALIKFIHNISPPFKAELVIMNSIGQVVKTIKKDMLTAYTGEFDFDCTNEQNEKLASGNYMFLLEVETIDGIRKSANGSLTIIK